MTTKLKSFAKFNLFLNILDYSQKHKKHRLYSLFVLSSQYVDKILISESDKNKNDLVVEYQFNKQPVDIKNCLVTKVLVYLQNKYKKNIKNTKIVIHKNIPICSGLGGGSSNAASIILWFYKRFKIPKSKQLSYEYIALNFGSDIPFFLSQNQSAIVSNFGDVITPINCLKIKHRIIINRIKCDTSKIFEAYRKSKKLNYRYQNDLMPIAFMIYPELYKNYLKLTKKYSNVLMSGSGSSFVVIENL